jgi:hypothetical protein
MNCNRKAILMILIAKAENASQGFSQKKKTGMVK